MEDKILQILDNVRYWDSCPDDYKETIGQFLADKEQSLQLLQSRVVGECEHPHNSTRTCKITELNTCSLCGKQWY